MGGIRNTQNVNVRFMHQKDVIDETSSEKYSRVFRDLILDVMHENGGQN